MVVDIYLLYSGLHHYVFYGTHTIGLAFKVFGQFQNLKFRIVHVNFCPKRLVRLRKRDSKPRLDDIIDVRFIMSI